MPGTQLTTRPKEANEPPVSDRPQDSSSAPFRLGWFAGGDLNLLERVPSERAFYAAVGAAVIVTGCIGGLAATLAVGSALQEPALRFWWVGAGWTVALIFCIERLLLKVPSTGNPWTFVASVALRLSLAFSVAFLLFSEPLIIRLYDGEINAQLNRENETARQEQYKATQAFYDPLIKEAKGKLQETRQRKAELQQKVKRDRRRSAEAAEQGQLAKSRFYAQTAEEQETRLRAVEQRNAHRQPELHEKLDQLRDRKGSAEQSTTETVDEGNGFGARSNALDAVIDEKPEIGRQLWGLRAALILLDLAPLAALIFHLRRKGPRPYEEEQAADWEADSLPALRRREAVAVEKQRIKEEARARMRLNQAAIAAEAERRILDATDGTYDGGLDEPLAAAMSSEEFRANVGIHEHLPVEIPADLRRYAVGGLASLCVSAAVAFLWTSAIAPLAWGWPLALAAGLGTALCVYSHGFREAPAWAMRPILGVFIAGIALPPFVALINLF